MLSRSCFVYSFCGREFCHQRRTVLLLSPVNALASPPHGRPFSQVKKEHRPVLPVGELRPFIKLTSAYREQGGGLPSPKRFDWKKFARAMPRFGDHEWGHYLSYLSHHAHIFPHNAGGEELMQLTLNSAVDWAMNKSVNLPPEDYFHLVNFASILAGKREYPDLDCSVIERVILMWFPKRFASLESSAFFEILKRQTVLCMYLGLRDSVFSGELLLKMIAHGVKLAPEAEIYDCLCLLRCIDYYALLEKKKGRDDEGYSAAPVLDIMAKKPIPTHRDDLEASLAVLAEYTGHPRVLSWRSVLRRGVQFQYHGAWNWLRYSIESVFEHDELRILRPCAALVAVRAYKWKAIDFSPDDVDRFLQDASSIYLKKPGPGPQLLFMKEPGVLQHAKAFLQMVSAILSAVSSDLPQLGKLSVRIDDEYWDELISVLEVEGLKTNHRMVTQKRLIRELVNLSKHITDEKVLKFVSRPFDNHRWEITRRLLADGRKLYGGPVKTI